MCVRKTQKTYKNETGFTEGAGLAIDAVINLKRSQMGCDVRDFESYIDLPSLNASDLR